MRCSVDIMNYEGLYAITKSGRVYSYKSKRFLKPGYNNDGYATINLCKDGRCVSTKVHRLVAEHFVANPTSLNEVNHLDGNKTNNHHVNLEWCTRSRNVKHGYDIGLSIPRNQQAVNVYQDQRCVGTFSSLRECARQLEIPFNSVRMTVIGKYSQTHGYEMRYAT